jgi:hypothetical protein
MTAARGIGIGIGHSDGPAMDAGLSWRRHACTHDAASRGTKVVGT